MNPYREDPPPQFIPPDTFWDILELWFKKTQARYDPSAFIAVFSIWMTGIVLMVMM